MKKKNSCDASLNKMRAQQMDFKYEEWCHYEASKMEKLLFVRKYSIFTIYSYFLQINNGMPQNVAGL